MIYVNKLYDKLQPFYRTIFPVVVIVSLIGIASINNRQFFLGSVCADFIVRVFLTLWFSILYYRSSNISSFSYFPNIKWTKSDVNGKEKYKIICLSFIFSAICGLVTYMVIIWFISSIFIIGFLVAILNSLLIFLPLLTHYWVFKV
jgi:hypothetical protein